MNFRWGVARVAAVGTAMLFGVVGCKREERPFRVDAPAGGTIDAKRLVVLQPGHQVPVHHVKNDYEDNAWAMSEGKRLFTQYNCSGCHSNGGGGMGPPLMDHKWIYGGAPEQISATIVEGRPNGMPSFRGKIPDHQVWQITAYVRSMSGMVPFDAAPNRNDDIQNYKPENSREKDQHPKQTFDPPQGDMPL